MPWQLQSLEALASTPTVDIAQAEQASLELSHFLTQAPTDFLEPLLNSPFGRVYKLFVERCCTVKFPGPSCRGTSQRSESTITELGCETPEGWAVLLALFPFFPPDELKVEDASSKLPAWIHTLYAARYEATEASPSHQTQQAILLLQTGSS